MNECVSQDMAKILELTAENQRLRDQIERLEAKHRMAYLDALTFLRTHKKWWQFWK